MGRQEDSEAALRSAISRAYYAALGVAYERLVDFGWTLPRGSIHHQVWSAYARSTDPRRRDIANLGFPLRNLRNDADYKRRFPYPLPETATEALHSADELIALLREIDADESGYAYATVLNAGRIVVFDNESTTCAVEASTGSMLWDDATFHHALLAVDGSSLYYMNHHVLHCYDTETFDIKWRRSGCLICSPSHFFTGERIVVFGQFTDGRLLGGGERGVYALDAKSGEVKWFVPCEDYGHDYAYTPMFDMHGDMVIVQQNQGELRAVDSQSGTTLWTYSGSGHVRV